MWALEVTEGLTGHSQVVLFDAAGKSLTAFESRFDIVWQAQVGHAAVSERTHLGGDTTNRSHVVGGHVGPQCGRLLPSADEHEREALLGEANQFVVVLVEANDQCAVRDLESIAPSIEDARPPLSG